MMRSYPVQGDQLLLKVFVADLRLVGVGKFADYMSLSIENLERHLLGRRWQIVIDGCAIGRVCCDGFVRWERRVSVCVALNAISERGCKQVRRTRNRG